jgi:hypothetical protein
MAGMHCDSCGGMFEYNEQVVATREDGGELVAGYTIEKEAGNVGETIQPVGKYHVQCYEKMRERQSDDWPSLLSD